MHNYYVGKVWGPRGGYWQAEQCIDSLSCELLSKPPLRQVLAHSKREAIAIGRRLAMEVTKGVDDGTRP